MNLIRVIFLGLAVMLPVSWTVAHAGDEVPAGEKTEKTTKKTKKSKKADGSEETKSETTKTEKKAE